MVWDESRNACEVRVNGQLIPHEAVEFELLRLVRFYREHMPEERIGEAMPALRRRALDQAIGAKLLIDEAMRLEIPVSDADVDERVRKAERDAGGTEKLNELLKRQGIDRKRFRDQMRRARRVDCLVEQVASQAPDPTEAQINEHFEAHREEYARVERAQVRHILVKPESDDDAARAAARGTLESIAEKLRGGAEFAEEAAAHSHCESGTRTGGSLGWVSRGMMVPPLDAAIFDMAVGELSDIIETEIGFHILVKTAEEPAAAADFDSVRESIREFLRHASRGQALAAFTDELRARATVDVRPLEQS